MLILLLERVAKHMRRIMRRGAQIGHSEEDLLRCRPFLQLLLVSSVCANASVSERLFVELNEGLSFPSCSYATEQSPEDVSEGR